MSPRERSSNRRRRVVHHATYPRGGARKARSSSTSRRRASSGVPRTGAVRRVSSGRSAATKVARLRALLAAQKGTHEDRETLAWHLRKASDANDAGTEEEYTATLPYVVLPRLSKPGAKLARLAMDATNAALVHRFLPNPYPARPLREWLYRDEPLDGVARRELTNYVGNGAIHGMEVGAYLSGLATSIPLGAMRLYAAFGRARELPVGSYLMTGLSSEFRDLSALRVGESAQTLYPVSTTYHMPTAVKFALSGEGRKLFILRVTSPNVRAVHIDRMEAGGGQAGEVQPEYEVLVQPGAFFRVRSMEYFYVRSHETDRHPEKVGAARKCRVVVADLYVSDREPDTILPPLNAGAIPPGRAPGGAAVPLRATSSSSSSDEDDDDGLILGQSLWPFLSVAGRRWVRKACAARRLHDGRHAYRADDVLRRGVRRDWGMVHRRWSHLSQDQLREELERRLI